jgi:hypothetical protein
MRGGRNYFLEEINGLMDNEVVMVCARRRKKLKMNGKKTKRSERI